MTESHALIILNAIPGIGNAAIHKAIAHYGSAQNVLSAGDDLIAGQFFSPKITQSILGFSKNQFLDKELALAAKHDAHILTCCDEGYPLSLKTISDSPIVLYVKGDLPRDLPLAIGVVGSRNASLYGISIAHQWSARLAEAGVTIVSGMARGIDTAAHKGALQSHGKTIAVLGCGLLNVYPPENKKLSEAIAASGAVVCEFSMGALPMPYNFPRRNRIISGLSAGVIVVEAAAKSGALITADFALEQGKEVYAVPGKVDSQNSHGVHELIKQGAKLVSRVDDIIEDLRPKLVQEIKTTKSNIASADRAAIESLDENERLVYTTIQDHPVHIDQLIDRCGTDALRTMTILSRLELKRLIKQLPGKLFVR